MSNNRPLIIVASVVLAIIGGSLWFLNSQKPAPVSTTAPVDINVPIGPSVNVPSTDDTPRVEPRPLATPKPGGSPVAGGPKRPAQPLQEWEIRIDEVLRSTADESQTAQILINMLPTLPADGQSEAAAHISNLLLDEQYSKVLPLVKNPALPEDVLDVFVTDLMNREDKVKLPTLLEIAKIPNHPHHEEAKTDLEIFLDEDYESDWNKWDAAVKAYLKKQEAEEAADAAAPGQ